MKLQYLGDWRDAFKWDLLHWLCVESAPAFDRLVFVPLLTPDDAEPVDGRIPAVRYQARPFIHEFVESLGAAPRDLRRVAELGAVAHGKPLHVIVHAHDRHVPAGENRRDYWRDFEWTHSNSIVFLDPDNGFETPTRRGDKWVFHAEVAQLSADLPLTSAVAVYQHRPQRQAWPEVFARLSASVTYAPFAGAAYDHGLAFVLVSQSQETYDRVRDAIGRYVAEHAAVSWSELR